MSEDEMAPAANSVESGGVRHDDDEEFGGGGDEHDDDYLPGTASLIEDLDKKLLVVLRDGRTLIGFLRSVDQFANLVLHNTNERIYVGRKFGDIPRGIFLIRGENVALLGEIDGEKERTLALEEVSVEEILERQRVESELKQRVDEARSKALRERGLNVHDAAAGALMDDF